MSDTVRGAVDRTGAFGFYIENTPLQYLAPDPQKYIHCSAPKLSARYR